MNPSDIHPDYALGQINHSRIGDDCLECNALTKALTKIDHLTKANQNLLKAVNVLGDKIVELEKLLNEKRDVSNDT